jgi:hypothetical protein
LITGAHRGISLEFVRQYLAQESHARAAEIPMRNSILCEFGAEK